VSALERQAHRLWQSWAVYRKHTTCSCCLAHRYCGAARQSGRWLCPPCFDTSPEAEQVLRRSA